MLLSHIIRDRFPAWWHFPTLSRLLLLLPFKRTCAQPAEDAYPVAPHGRHRQH